MILHQSDLASWSRCPMEWKLEHDGNPGKVLSRTVYGTVMHHACHVLERTGDLELAIQTFTHYWEPFNRTDLVEADITDWLPGDNQWKLQQRGVTTLRNYWDHITDDDHELLALEYEFIVPIHGTVDRETGVPHMLAGTVDRLAARHYKRKFTLCCDDWKTGKQPTYLRHNAQGTAYCYASTLPEFWRGNPEYHTEGFGDTRGAALFDRFLDIPRRFWWINLRGEGTSMFKDGGFRGPRDYDRFAFAAQQVADSIQANIFPLTLKGEVCQYCSFRDICPDGVGLDDKEGDPAA